MGVIAKAKRILLCARESVIEPLGLMYLASVARDEGWDVKIHLVGTDGDCVQDFLNKVEEFQPSVIGLSVYTGWQRQAASLVRLAKAWTDALVVIGGPYPTCFPDGIPTADRVVVGSGLASLREILRGVKRIKVVGPEEPLPLPSRSVFYQDYPSYADSPIKSVLASTGCPYACSYCYNSMGKGLFPHVVRDPATVLMEVREAFEWPVTKLVYFQDDAFGFSRPWLQEFQRLVNSDPFPYHCQMRAEMVTSERRDALVMTGCTGVTMALESGIESVRREILNRNMTDDQFAEAVRKLASANINIRTEQMLGLPVEELGIEADLQTLKMNVDLFQEHGQPVMAWASIFVPYMGTKAYDYCVDNLWYNGDNDDAPATFFERSILNFDEKYKDQMLWLRDRFHLFATIPQGHKIARQLSYNMGTGDDWIRTDLKKHLYDEVLYGIGEKDDK